MFDVPDSASSYQAGYEYGERHASGVEVLSGTKPTEHGARAVCASAANIAEDSESGIWWSEGHLARADLDVDAYQEGCLDALNVA